MRILTRIGAAIAMTSSAFGQEDCPARYCSIGIPPRPAGWVSAFAIYPFNGQPGLFVGGVFNSVGGQNAQNLAIWQGGSWTSLMPGADGEVRVLKVMDDGSGPKLYAGGRFSNIAGIPANYVARYDGTSWAPVGLGLLPDPVIASFTNVHALEYFDAGQGPELYAGGFLSLGGSPPAQGIAKLSGTSWVPVGGGIAGVNQGSIVAVGALSVYDDGTGPALFVGGSFRFAGGQAVRNVAKWDGAAWHPLGAGLNEPASPIFVPTVTSLLPYTESGVTTLLAGGDFEVGTVNGIAAWNGVEWSASYGDFDPDGVTCLAIEDMGAGPALYAGGPFSHIDGVSAGMLARRTQGAWQPVGELLYTPNSRVRRVKTFADADGLALYVGGRFLGSPDSTPDSQTAMLRYGTILADLDCDGVVGLQDLAILLSALGVSNAGDLDGDGVTRLADLAILLSRFGEGCG